MTLIIEPIKNFPLVEAGQSLVELLMNCFHQMEYEIEDGDIIVIAQKVISKSENRYRNLSEVQPSSQALKLSEEIGKDPRLVELILQESNSVLRTRPGTIIVEHRLGFICANAGIDHSNVKQIDEKSEERVLLLPEDPDRSANEIKTGIFEKTNKDVGVLIIDSHGRAWRNGTVGTTIGLAGVPGVVDMRGKEDLFGYKLKVTTIAVADDLAAAASLLMGEAAEATPVVIVRGFPYALRESSLNELIRPKELDLFR